MSALVWGIKKRARTHLPVLMLVILVLPPFMFGCIRAFQVIRHVDPAEVREEPLISTGLIAFYSNVVWMMATERYNLTLQELDRGLSIYIPQNLRFTASRFNSLLEEVSTDLRTVKTRIGDAEASLEQGKLEEAEENLEEARLILQGVYIMIDDLESAAEHLAESLKSARYPLSNRISELKDLADKYTGDIQYLSSWLRDERSLSSVRLTLWVRTLQEVNVTKAALGDFVRMGGVLMKEDGERLTSKLVGIYIENLRVGDAYTDGEGYYHTLIQIPYIYKHQVEFFSLFEPSTQDEGRYPTVRSSPITVELLYGKPYFIMDEVEPAFPGTQFNISGQLYQEKTALQDHLLNITGLGETVSAETSLNGDFEAAMTVPADFPEGSYPLVVEAYPKGLIGPASTILNVKVLKLIVNMQVEAPRIAFAGLTLTLRGYAKVDGVSMDNLRITGRVGDLSSTTQTSRDGSFKLDLKIPLTAYTMKYSYTISTASAQSWISPSSVEDELLIVNPLTLVLFLSIAVIAALKVRLPRRRIEVSEPTYPVTSIPQSESTLKILLKGLASYYWQAVETISAETGVTIKPNYTIREYLEAVAKKIKVGEGGKSEDRYLDFKALSLVFEKSLYSDWVIFEEKEEAYKAFHRLVGDRTEMPEHKFCINCGRRLSIKKRQCDKCGEPIRSERES